MQSLWQYFRQFVIPSFATTGARIVLDGTTNAIFVYNSSNQLIASMAAGNGQDQYGNKYITGYTTYDPEFQTFVNVNGGNVLAGAFSSYAVGPDTTDAASFNGNGHGVGLLSSGVDTTTTFTDAAYFRMSAGQQNAGSGSGVNPFVRIIDSAGNSDVDALISGNLISATQLGGAYTWQTPSYGTNWSASTTFNGSANWGSVKYRKLPIDAMWIGGGFKAGATLPTNPVFNVVAPYRPKSQWPLTILRNNGGTLSTFFAEITTGGNLDISSQPGGGIAAGNEYLIAPTIIPLENIA